MGASRTFCSRKRPSMMLLHRSSIRFRSTTWSRTSSRGFAAGRVPGVDVLPSPTAPATPAPCPPYQGPRAASPAPPTRSLPRAACAPSGPHAAAEALGAAGPGAPSCGGQARSGRPVCGGLGRPTASAACHVLTHPLTSPTSTHRSTLYSPGFSSRAAECPLPPMAPLQEEPQFSYMREGGPKPLLFASSSPLS